MKKQLLFLTLFLISVATFSQKFTSGGLSYTVTSPTEVSVGKGATCPVGALIIPATVVDGATTYDVTAIDASAFNSCGYWNITDLTSVVIPNSVKTIGGGAFGYCKNLTSITLPNSVTSIGGYAFPMTSLKSLHVSWANPLAIGASYEFNRGQKEQIFGNIDLYVPSGTIALYAAATGWKDFSLGTWTGATDKNWDTASNWSINDGTNTVPANGVKVRIPAGLTNYPTANNAIENSVTIESGASFIPLGTVTGTVTYSRNIPDTNWHLVATLSGETYENIIKSHSFATGTGTNIGIGDYSNATGAPWIYTQADNTDDLSSAISIKLAAAGDLVITGTANSSDVTTAITAGTRTNLNLIGNPFTSYVNAATFLGANTGSLSEETIWLWNGTTYVTYNAANSIEIAPGQAFFVDVASNGNVTFATSNQSHQADTFMRPAPKTSFELFVENETSKKSTKVFYIADKTTGFDNGYDSKAFTDAKNDFDVFTELVSDNKGNKLAIQSLPNTDLEAIVVPVGITAKAGEEVTFSVNSQNFPSDVKIYLEDRIANTFTDISENSHKVVLVNAANGAGQFYIHTTSENLEIASIQPELSKNVSIYKSENNSITISGLQTKNATLNVFSVLGQKIISKSFKSTGSNIIQLPKTSKGVYIIELNSDLGTINKKIILE